MLKHLRELNRKTSQKIIESDIKAYLVYLRTKKKLSYRSASMYLVAIKKFYYVNSDYQFKWDLITSYLGNDDTEDDYNDYNNKKPLLTAAGQEDDYDDETSEGGDRGEDRPYSKEEIKTMFNAAQDIRVKIVISLLASSGLRYGAIPILKLKDLEKIDKYIRSFA